jgi:hypothetical protein
MGPVAIREGAGLGGPLSLLLAAKCRLTQLKHMPRLPVKAYLHYATALKGSPPPFFFGGLPPRRNRKPAR